MVTDSILPQQSVIGSMLINEDCIGPTIGKLRADDFTLDVYRKLFQAIRALFSAGTPVDPVTVLDALKNDRSCDWYEVIKLAMEQTPTAANVDLYVKIMVDQARLVRIQELAGKLTECRDLEDAGAFIAQLNGESVSSNRMRTVTMEQGLAEFIQRQETKEEYFRWGFSQLDSQLHVGRGKFVILGGYASHGKTALALSLALTLSKEHRVGFYSLETDDRTLHDRMVSSLYQISLSRIKRRELTEEDFKDLATGSDQYNSHHLEIILAAGHTVEEIFAHAQSRRYDVILVDYIQLIPGVKGRGRTEEVTSVSIALHTKIQSTGITVVGLSQLSRPDKDGKVQRAPRMSDLRESGQLEQDADVILMLYKEAPDNPKSRRVLSVEKNKEGEVGQVYLSFDGDLQTFRAHYNQSAPPPPKRKEPEYKQVEFKELYGQDPDLPFREVQNEKT